MSRLLDHFQRIVVISLPDRSDRREKLLANLADCSLATENDITWFDAVDGRQECVPGWWKSGPGAWGCRFSQLKVIEQAERDQLSNILIIEDDTVFHPRSAQWLDEIMPVLPADWGQLFLGGQHMRNPSSTSNPKIVKGRCITRTHAYAVNHTIFRTLIDQISNDSAYRKNPGGHVDHHYGDCQEKGLWNAYAPSWWIAGQEEGDSNIAHANFKRRWWQEGQHYWKLPLIVLSEKSSLTTSNSLFFGDTPPPNIFGQLALWIRKLAREAWSQGRLPAIVNTDTGANPRAYPWPAGTQHPNTAAQLKQLADYPHNGIFPHPFALTTIPTEQKTTIKPIK